MADKSRKGLGKGLDSIFGTNVEQFLDDIQNNGKEVPGRREIEIAIDEIRANPYQPRKEFDEKALQDLSNSIKVHGIFTPLLVRKSQAKGYELIAGERRFRACKKAGFEKISCYILSPSENQAAEMALVENIQREDLTAIEEAKSYVQIMRQAGLTQEQVAQKVGKSQSAVANKIRLLNLPDEIQAGVLEKKISERHARSLLRLPEEKRVDAYHHIVKEEMNVRQADAYVEKLSLPAKTHKRQKTKGFSRNMQLGINTINESIQMVKGLGIDVVSEIEESDMDVKIIIRFPK